MIKIIKNVLPKEVADQLVVDILATQSSWWSYAHKFSEKDATLLNNNLGFQLTEELFENKVKENFRAGKFSYKFRRSTNHVKNCSCYECSFKSSYLLKSIRDIVIEYTFLKNPYIFENFISIYAPGDFLSMHTDGARGVAFILNLSQNWIPEYGGLLHVKNKDGTFTAYVPEYNSLVLMDVANDASPHFVSEVSKYAPSYRMAIGGWFNES